MVDHWVFVVCSDGGRQELKVRGQSTTPSHRFVAKGMHVEERDISGAEKKKLSEKNS